MKIVAWSVLALAGSLVVPVRSAFWTEQEQDGEASEAAEEKTPLVVSMEVIEDGLRALRPDLTDGAKLSTRLELVVSMQSAAKATKTIVPPFAEKQTEEQRAAFVLAYRKEMIGVEEELLRLERAILDVDLAAAKESYKKLKQMEEDGHARFTKDG